MASIIFISTRRNLLACRDQQLAELVATKRAQLTKMLSALRPGEMQT